MSCHILIWGRGNRHRLKENDQTTRYLSPKRLLTILRFFVKKEYPEEIEGYKWNEQSLKEQMLVKNHIFLVAPRWGFTSFEENYMQPCQLKNMTKHD